LTRPGTAASSGRAQEVIGEVCQAVAQWRSVATSHEIGAAEQDLFAEVIDTQVPALLKLIAR
jgi:hypothetical protein